MQGVVIAGTHSGSGKTTITLGLLAALKKKGYTVQPFKTGPDFIDTGLHGHITGRPSRNLDLWMCGREYVRECFGRNSADADIAVIEGVMGMYDGDRSTASLAAELELPVILVVDAFGMAESAGAIVKGFAEYSGKAGKRGSGEVKDRRADIAGVIFNRIASERHYKRVKESVQDIPVLGYLPRDIDFNIPHRHLGLVVAEENPIDAKEVDKLADAILKNIDVDKIVDECKRRGKARLAPTCELTNMCTCEHKIGVAYDKAFCFYYEDNLDLLKQAGAEIVKFSPLSDNKLPDDIDALYIGGGYPELYAGQLSANSSMLRSIREFAESGMPVYAECGGFMYLTEGVYDLDEEFHSMVGVYPFKTKMTKKRAGLGYREALLKEDSMLGEKGALIRGHEFHYSEIVESAEARKRESAEVYSVKDGSGNFLGDEGYMVNNTLGSYMHIHFGSNQKIAKNIIDLIREHNGKNNNCGTRQS